MPVVLPRLQRAIPGDLAVRLMNRYQRGLSRQSTARTIWQDMAELMAPHLSNITVTRTEGARQTQRVFDSTAIHASELLTGSMVTTMISPAHQWFSLKVRQKPMNERDDVSEWLEDSADRMYLAINQSNFIPEAGTMLLSLTVFGTGSLLVEERRPDRLGTFGGLLCHAYPPGGYVIEEGADGRVDTVFRRFELPARTLGDLFPHTLPEETRRLAEERGDESVEIVHAVFPRGPGFVEGRFPWTSAYLLPRWKAIVHLGGYFENPWVVPRWDKDPGELYGRGPGHTAFPHVATLNRAVELKLQAWAKQIDPPLLTEHEGVFGELSLNPAAINTVLNPQTSVKALDIGARMDVTAIQEEQLRGEIRRIFFTDQLVLAERANMTATEAQIRYELMLRLLGARAGRFQSEFLQPFIDRVFAIMLRAGALAPPPEILLEEGAEIDIEYQSPLARAQRASDLVAIERWLALLQGLAPIDPRVAHLADVDRIARHVARVAGVPSDLVTDELVVGMRREQEAQQAARAQQAQALMAAAEAAGKAAPMVRALPEAAEAVAGGGR